MRPLNSLQWDWARLASTSCSLIRRLLSHPLFVALATLAAGVLLAYLFTERWQRHRQRREFQLRAMVKFNELSYDLLDRMSELLTANPQFGALFPNHEYPSKHREFVSRWTIFVAMRDELAAVFDEKVLEDYDLLQQTTKSLKDMISAMPPVERGAFEHVRDRFLGQRQITAIRMIGNMGFFKKKEVEVAVERWKTKPDSSRVSP